MTLARVMFDMNVDICPTQHRPKPPVPRQVTKGEWTWHGIPPVNEGP
jgi:hypothetical protein